MAANPRVASRFEISQQAALILAPFLGALTKVATRVAHTEALRIQRQMPFEGDLSVPFMRQRQERLKYTTVLGLQSLPAVNLDDELLRAEVVSIVGLPADADAAAYIERMRKVLADNPELAEAADVDVVTLHPSIANAVEMLPVARKCDCLPAPMASESPNSGSEETNN